MNAPSSTPAIPGSAQGHRYWAFISYSHKDDGWSRRVLSGVESYRVPRRLVGTQSAFGWPVPKRIMPLFRDIDELSTSADLSNNLTAALEQSHTLVVICSPHSARSRWVHEEVRHYKRLGMESRVMALIVDGKPNASDDDPVCHPECFPLALRRKLTPEGEIAEERVEPLAADVSDSGTSWRIARLKLVAGILGVPLDVLRRRDKERARLRMGVWCIFSVLLVAAFAGYRQWLAEEYRQKQITALMADAQRHFVDRHLLHAGVALLEANKLGLAADGMGSKLDSVSRALVMLEDTLPSAARRIESIAFSPDSKRIGVASDDGRASVWALAPGGALLASRIHPSPRAAAQLAFHPAGSQIGVALWDGTIRAWPYQDAGAPTVCTGHYRKIRVNAVDFSSNGNLMATGGDDTFVKLWDTRSWTVAGPDLAEHNDFVKSVKFSPDGSLVVTAGFDGVIKVFSVASRTLVAEIAVKDQINRAVITSDNLTVIAAGRNGTAWIGSIPERKVVKVIDHAHANRINDLALHPDKTSFFTASDDGYVRLWRIEDRELLLSIEDHGVLRKDPLLAAVKILAVAVAPDGQRVASAGDDGQVKVWRLDGAQRGQPGETLERLRQRTQSAFSSIDN